MRLTKKSNELKKEDELKWHTSFAWLPVRVNNTEIQWFREVARKRSRYVIDNTKTWKEAGSDFVYSDKEELLKGKLADADWASDDDYFEEKEADPDNIWDEALQKQKSASIFQKDYEDYVKDYINKEEIYKQLKDIGGY